MRDAGIHLPQELKQPLPWSSFPYGLCKPQCCWETFGQMCPSWHHQPSPPPTSPPPTSPPPTCSPSSCVHGHPPHSYPLTTPVHPGLFLCGNTYSRPCFLTCQSPGYQIKAHVAGESGGVLRTWTWPQNNDSTLSLQRRWQGWSWNNHGDSFTHQSIGFFQNVLMFDLHNLYRGKRSISIFTGTQRGKKFCTRSHSSKQKSQN